jgi:hypothetical protein
MSKYEVHYHVRQDWICEIEAESEEEAINKAIAWHDDDECDSELEYEEVGVKEGGYLGDAILIEEEAEDDE